MLSSNIKLVGYDTLGIDGNEGIRYAWRHSSSPFYVESAAFVQRSKEINDNVCGYTTSVSSGCILQSMNLACKFCRTGTLLPFGGFLTAEEIAKQNIFMVLSDMNCSNHVELKTKQREFAYMGQGESGFSYNQVRKAIELTNIAMKKLGQTVFRHIIATSGIPIMIEKYLQDLKNDVFSSKTTMHFSLHGTANRTHIMPINSKFSYKDSLKVLAGVVDVSGEKPCIGVLLLNNFMPKGRNQPYTTNFNTVKNILEELNPNQFRLSFCEFNGSSELGTFDPYQEMLEHKILDYAQKKGFEAKMFSSFGKEEVAACGMLGGKEPQKYPSSKWIELEQRTEEIIVLAEHMLNERKEEF